MEWQSNDTGTLLCELYHIVWHFNPICARAASRITTSSLAFDIFSTSTCTRKWARAMGLNDLEAVGVSRKGSFESTCHPHRRLRFAASTIALPIVVIPALYGHDVRAEVSPPFMEDPSQRQSRKVFCSKNDRGTSFSVRTRPWMRLTWPKLREVLNQVTLPAAQDAVVESIRVNFHQITPDVAAI
jgi:hypothetical protein